MAVTAEGFVLLLEKTTLKETAYIMSDICLVGYSNGIIAAGEGGTLTIMNESHEIIKKIPGTNHDVLSLCGNSIYLAFGDRGGFVRYYKRNSDMEPKVIFLGFELYIIFLELQT